MKATQRWCLALAVTAFLAATSVVAQFPGMQGPPSFRGVWAPVVGAGATYEMDSRREGKMQMEVAIVGTEPVMGKTGHWVETVMQTRQGEMIMKVLTSLDGKELKQLRMVMQAPREEPMEISMEMMSMMGGGRRMPAQRADAREGATKVGTESITVPAGTFTCDHYKTADGADVWIAEKGGPWGLVKMTSSDGTLTLLKVVSDAKTKIKGTPRKMEDMMRNR
jgi:hypothetical protein